jgi:outer membrane protein assembly factor BamB
LAASSDGVVALQRADGREVWTFSALSTAAEWRAFGHELSAFRLTETTLFFLQGRRRMIALDVIPGRMVWSRGAPGWFLDLPPPAGRIGQHYYVDDAHLLLEHSGGLPMLLSAKCGAPSARSPGGQSPWAQPPVFASEGQVFFAPDPRHLVRFDLAKSGEVWKVPLPETGALSGEMPQLISDTQRLLAVIPRNYAWMLQCFDPATGKALWPREVLVSRARPTTGRMALGREAIYFEDDSQLRAHSLTAGKRLWTAPLGQSDARWQIRCHGRWIVAYPCKSAEPNWPVCILDAKDGQSVQRLNVSMETKEPAVPDVRIGAGSLVVSLPGKVVHWRSAPLPNSER